jgi:TRAP-type C4-dicarboxylate transport system substrate-binding protein
MERKVLDGYSGLTFDVGYSFKLHEVAPYVIDTGAGVYAGAAAVINLDLWNSLDKDIQKAMNEASERFAEYITELYVQEEAAICKQFLANGGHALVLPDAEVDRWKAAVGDSVRDAWISRVSGTVGESFARDFLAQYEQKLRAYEATSTYLPGVRACANAG